MDHRATTPQKDADRRPPSAKQAAAVCIVFGVVISIPFLPNAWVPLAKAQAGVRFVFVAASDASGPVFGSTVAALGLFTLWACRKPRSTDFKAAAFALVVLLWPLVIVGIPLLYGPVCGWWLRLHNYERCDPSQAGQTFATRGRGRTPLTTYAHLPQGGCAALPRPGSGLLPASGSAPH